ncbi:MAG: YkgJ family cysteine cluster protein [Rhodospirillaceae bacterium]|nr:YkgJ family cysteine cluster protein [Rhodospirillales bacterium]
MLSASDEFLIEAAREELSRCWPKPTIDRLCAALDAVFSVAEASWASRRTNLTYMLSSPAPACKAGCGWCCHQQVGVSVPEAIRVAVHIQSLPVDQRAPMAARLAQVAGRTQGMTTDDRAHARVACPFLGTEGRCMIYAVRPLRCRGLHSIDVDFCIACFDDIEAMRAKLAAGQLKPVFLDTPQAIFDSALAGVLKALSKAAPKAVVSLELAVAVNALLEQPRLAERWLAGARPDRTLHLQAEIPV